MVRDIMEKRAEFNDEFVPTLGFRDAKRRVPHPIYVLPVMARFIRREMFFDECLCLDDEIHVFYPSHPFTPRR